MMLRLAAAQQVHEEVGGRLVAAQLDRAAFVLDQ